MRHLVLLPLCLLAAGCLTTYSSVYRDDLVGPKGERLVEISCINDVDHCFEQARQSCGGDYDLVSQPSDSTLMVHCKSSDGPAGQPIPCTSNAQCPLAQRCEQGTGVSGLCTPR